MDGEEEATHSLRNFDQNGYAIVEDALDEVLIDEIRSHLDWTLERNPDIDPENPLEFGDQQPLEHPFLARLVSDDRLLDIVEQIFGPNVVHLQSIYFVKTPDESKKTYWHQDGAYYAQFVEPLHVVGLWIALDEATPENGCLRVVPGSHRDGYVEHEMSGVVQEDVAENDTEIDESSIDESEAIDLTLDPGDVALIHPSILHSAYANTSDEWRRAYVARYVPATVTLKQLGEAGHRESLLLRGEPGENQAYWRLPLYDPDDHRHFDNWEAYNEKAKRLNEKVPNDQLMSASGLPDQR